MRLIDSTEGHHFSLPPDNVVLLAPALPWLPSPPPLREIMKIHRKLVVHNPDGSSHVWEQTTSGWRKRRET